MATRVIWLSTSALVCSAGAFGLVGWPVIAALFAATIAVFDEGDG